MKIYECRKCLGRTLPCYLVVTADSNHPAFCPIPDYSIEKDHNIYNAEWGRE